MYENLGKTRGPGVAWAAFVAFVVPVLVFLAALAGADALLRKCLEGRALTLAGFLLAAGITLTAIVLIRLIRARWTASNRKQQKQGFGLRPRGHK